MNALVVGDDGLLSSGPDGKILRWALRDHHASVEEAEPHAEKAKPHAEVWLTWPTPQPTNGMTTWIRDMQVC